MSVSELAKRVERTLSRGNGSYRCLGFFKATLAGVEAHGFDYEYEAQGVPQVGQTLVFRSGTRCYTLYWHARQKDVAAEALFASLLPSIALDSG